MRLGAQLLLILGLLMLPIGLLLTEVVQAARVQFQATAAEREGVNQLAALAPLTAQLLEAGDTARAIAGGLAADIAYRHLLEGADRALAELASQLQQATDPAALATELDALKSAWAAAASADQLHDLQRAAALLAPVIDAAAHLRQQILDRSGISLDPDLDTYHLGVALGHTLPRLLSETGQLRAWLTFALAKSDGLSPADRTALRQRHAALDALLQVGLADWRAVAARVALANPAAGAALDPAVVGPVQAYRQRAHRVIQANQPGDAATAWHEGGDLTRQLQAISSTALPVLGQLLAEREARLRRHLAQALAVVTVTLVVAGYFGLGFYRVMSGGLREMERSLAAIATGDLTGARRPRGRDEIAQLMHTTSQMCAALCATVGTVRQASVAVNVASKEMAAAAQELSARSEYTASSLERAASAMEQIAGTVRANANHVEEASSIANRNAGLARDGGAVMAQVVVTMESINAASQRIGVIVGTIDGIAFQTSLLSLNAAVEAARSRDHGRGFGVVAAEVRALSRRTAGSAREIRVLIGRNVDEVTAGVSVVNAARQAMDQIVEMASQIDALIDGIAHATSEQGAGITQVFQAVSDLEGLTQQSAALAEQTAATAEGLHLRAVELAKGVARFKLPEPA